MNYIPEVAKILGVKVGEEFDILVNETEMLVHGPYKFTDNALVDYVGCKTKDLLYRLLTGEYTLQKCSWKPKQGNLCWFIKTDGTVCLDRFRVDSQHLSMLSMGNCFGEASEAEAHIEEMVEKYKKIEMEMVKW